MAIYAPETPTRHELHAKYPVSTEATQRIQIARRGVVQALRHGFFASGGPCGVTEAIEIIDREGDALHNLQQGKPGLKTAHRLSVWKPRTLPEEKYWGLETVPGKAETAFQIIHRRAVNTANVMMEMGCEEHVRRYGHLVIAMWGGSRNANNLDLVRTIAEYDHNITALFKSETSGQIEQGLTNVNEVNRIRGGDGAPAVLIYRGGEEVRTPRQWEYVYRSALERTGGLLMVDTAHGSEMAHDPTGNFKKSSDGQLACMDHVINIAETTGEMAAAVIMEISDAETATDPVSPFSQGIDRMQRMYELKMQSREMCTV